VETGRGNAFTLECGNLLPLSQAATCRGQLEAEVTNLAATSRRYQSADKSAHSKKVSLFGF